MDVSGQGVSLPLADLRAIGVAASRARRATVAGEASVVEAMRHISEAQLHFRDARDAVGDVVRILGAHTLNEARDDSALIVALDDVRARPAV